MIAHKLITSLSNYNTVGKRDGGHYSGDSGFLSEAGNIFLIQAAVEQKIEICDETMTDIFNKPRSLSQTLCQFAVPST